MYVAAWCWRRGRSGGQPGSSAELRRGTPMVTRPMTAGPHLTAGRPRTPSAPCSMWPGPSARRWPSSPAPTLPLAGISRPRSGRAGTASPPPDPRAPDHLGSLTWRVVAGRRRPGERIRRRLNNCACPSNAPAG